MFAIFELVAVLGTAVLAGACWTGRYKEWWLTEGGGYSSEFAAGVQSASILFPFFIFAMFLSAPPEWLTRWPGVPWDLVSLAALAAFVGLSALGLVLVVSLKPRFLVPPRLRDRRSLVEQRRGERERPSRDA